MATSTDDIRTTPSDRIGELVAGRYRIVRLLGQGGMGAVYEVEHLALRRAFALKLLLADQAQSGESLDRFRQEAGVIASLRHPNIVEIVDWLALRDGTPGMVMEFLSGQSLFERLKQGPLPWPSIAHLGDELLSALAVAHKASIIHRDLKPANIFIVRDDGADERLKLLDFGVSKITGRGHTLTQAGYVLGSPPYMSPEQMSSSSDKLTPATDLWSTAVILYEMTTGKRPFAARNLADLADQIRDTRPKPLTDLRPDAPAALSEVLARAMAIDPEKRFPNAGEMRRALAAALKPILRALPSVTGQPIAPPVAAAPVDDATRREKGLDAPRAADPSTEMMSGRVVGQTTRRSAFFGRPIVVQRASLPRGRRAPRAEASRTRARQSANIPSTHARSSSCTDE